MRWKEGDGPVKVGGNREVEEIVRDLRSGSNVQAARAAEELYLLTSFASAVSIDDKSALTTYDAKVFGTLAEGAENASDAASVSVEGSLQVPMNPEEVGGDVHVDGKRYLMGDGFMLMEDTPDGSKDSDGARARRVAVSHSRCCIENRVLIGRAQGVFEGLFHVLEQGSSDGQLQASRALSQIAFRNAENKRAFGAIPGALRALGGVVQRALAAGEKRPLAEACRALGVLVAGDADNQEQAGMDKELVQAPPPSLLLPLPMSLLYTPSVDTELVQARASSACAEPAPCVPPAPQPTRGSDRRGGALRARRRCRRCWSAATRSRRGRPARWGGSAPPPPPPYCSPYCSP